MTSDLTIIPSYTTHIAYSYRRMHIAYSFSYIHITYRYRHIYIAYNIQLQTHTHQHMTYSCRRRHIAYSYRHIHIAYNYIHIQITLQTSNCYPTIIALEETKITQTVNTEFHPHLDNYTYLNIASSISGGSVGVFIKNNINYIYCAGRPQHLAEQIVGNTLVGN